MGLPLSGQFLGLDLSPDNCQMWQWRS